ncbi:CTD small phosphatase-like protein 2 [Forsythia ovata]|uniref:Mitochondrial import inner membrane translocase subunit TIM50 n=1 Tax=Forsythia ovata TaxID=205694 RepID=A0ABD1XDD4_9LAMI
MQTKKKVTGRNSRDLASPRVSRHQKKLYENVQVQAKKVTELITSSVRKKKLALFQRMLRNLLLQPIWDTRFRLVEGDDSNACLGYDTTHELDNAFINTKEHDDGTTHCVGDTIFSPSFHITRNIGGEISTGDVFKFFQHGDHQFWDCGNENIKISCPGGGNLSAEVPAVHLSMKNSNLECVEHENQDHMAADVCLEDEEVEEFDDFDPLFFIKNLPELSSVVPTYRPVLLPKQTRSCPSTTLVLDLDETLVHSTLQPCDDCRFHVLASQSIYAEPLLKVLDPKRKIFRHRVYRESCVHLDDNYLKDLSILGRDLAHVVMIDNSPQAFGFQVDNGIPIESWFDDRSDTELLSLLPFLESLVGVEDVRPVIAKKFNLREKIAAAVCPLGYSGGDTFER